MAKANDTNPNFDRVDVYEKFSVVPFVPSVDHRLEENYKAVCTRDRYDHPDRYEIFVDLMGRELNCELYKCHVKIEGYFSDVCHALNSKVAFGVEELEQLDRNDERNKKRNNYGLRGRR